MHGPPRFVHCCKSRYPKQNSVNNHSRTDALAPAYVCPKKNTHSHFTHGFEYGVFENLFRQYKVIAALDEIKNGVNGSLREPKLLVTFVVEELLILAVLGFGDHPHDSCLVILEAALESGKGERIEQSFVQTVR